MSDVPEWVKDLEEDARDKWNQRLWTNADVLKLLSALKCATEALEFYKHSCDEDTCVFDDHCGPLCEDEGKKAIEAFEKIRKGEFE